MNFRIIYLDRRDAELAENLLDAVWNCLERDRLLESLFYDGSVKSRTDFYNEILRDGCLPFVVAGDGEMAAFSWLNCITGKAARTHFAVFRKFWGKRMRCEIGRHLYRYILTRKDKLGYLLDCLYGITPERNPLAWKAALSCGWKKSGEIANACYVAKEGKSVNGIVTCATREILAIADAESAIWDA